LKILHITSLSALLLLSDCGASSLSQGNAPSSMSEQVKDPVWTYGETKDDMRGTVSRFATIDSINAIPENGPEMGGALNFTLFGPGDDASIVLSTDAQFVCGSDGFVAVKFDDGPVLNFNCHEPSSGNTKLLQVDNLTSSLMDKSVPENVYPTITHNLMAAKTMTIEVEIFESGRQQMKFNVTGFNKDKIN